MNDDLRIKDVHRNRDDLRYQDHLKKEDTCKNMDNLKKETTKNKVICPPPPLSKQSWL